MDSSTSLVCNLGLLDTLSDDSVQEILESYSAFCAATGALLNGSGDLSVGPDFISHVHVLCKHGLHSLVRDHFLQSLEVVFEKNGASRFWRHFDVYNNITALGKNGSAIDGDQVQQVLCKALEEICLEKQYQEKCVLILVHALLSYKESVADGKHSLDKERIHLVSKYQLMVSSVLMAALPRHFPGMHLIHPSSPHPLPNKPNFGITISYCLSYLSFNGTFFACSASIFQPMVYVFHCLLG
ncbi:hypothetical protein SLEP1_g22470 [Rubroshorea leprosula]|uniref:Uncharacterized protein n=1 Tax=Rubroshorea leprosula TaxID=152421 RepID=A0AAV5J9A9_9ROSI|nr:hypothetical protein SLEP1_g22470 [Rubroshorea leprosula]